jgi:hypothetical protein
MSYRELMSDGFVEPDPRVRRGAGRRVGRGRSSRRRLFVATDLDVDPTGPPLLDMRTEPIGLRSSG